MQFSETKGKQQKHSWCDVMSADILVLLWFWQMCQHPGFFVHVNFELLLALRMTSVIMMIFQHNMNLFSWRSSDWLRTGIRWRNEWELLGYSPVFPTILSQGPMWLQMSINCWMMVVIMSYFCTLWGELGNFR